MRSILLYIFNFKIKTCKYDLDSAAEKVNAKKNIFLVFKNRYNIEKVIKFNTENSTEKLLNYFQKMAKFYK